MKCLFGNTKVMVGCREVNHRIDANHRLVQRGNIADIPMNEFNVIIFYQLAGWFMQIKADTGMAFA